MKHLEAVLRDVERPAAEWEKTAARLARTAPGPALLAAIRAVGAGGARAIADRYLRLLPKPRKAEREAATQHASVTIDQIKRFGGAGEVVARAALEGIAKGADPTYLLRSIAQTLDQLRASTAALDVIRGALAVAPKDRGWYEDTHALVLLSLARFDEAAAAIARLAKVDKQQAAWLRGYAHALRQPFTHWNAPMFEDPDDDGVATKRSLAEARKAISAIASRIAKLRAALVAQVGDAAWLPDVRGFKPGKVDRAFRVDPRAPVPDLIWSLRKEWSRLCWLLTCLGERELRMPRSISTPPQPLDYYDTILSIRFNLLVARKHGTWKPTDDLDRRTGELPWGGEGGMKLKHLAPYLAPIWIDEVSSALAAVRWSTAAIDSVLVDQ